MEEQGKQDWAEDRSFVCFGANIKLVPARASDAANEKQERATLSEFEEPMVRIVWFKGCNVVRLVLS